METGFFITNATNFSFDFIRGIRPFVAFVIEKGLIYVGLSQFHRSAKNGLSRRSAPIVVAGPWPG
jgi:hypothetical protein